jgi:AcrR family transcriptional regulator
LPETDNKRSVREARSELYRQLILEAAERSFAARGVDEAKMEEIAAESGLSLGTLYSVFRGKAELVRAIHETRLREVLLRTIDAVRGVDDPAEMLLLGVRSYVEFFVVHPDYLRMHLREGYAWGLGGSVATSKARTDAWSEGVAMQTALFQRGIDQQTICAGNPELMARMMIAMQQVQLADWVERDMATDPQTLIRDIQDQLQRSFFVSQS